MEMSLVTWIIPVFTLMLFTIISIFVNVFAKIYALRKGKISQKEFKKNSDFLNEKNQWLEVTSRHLNSLFKTPILFYICFIIIMIDDKLSSMVFLLTLGWLYVFFRIANSFVYLTTNNLLLRLATFIIYNGILFTLISILLIIIIKNH